MKSFALVILLLAAPAFAADEIPFPDRGVDRLTIPQGPLHFKGWNKDKTAEFDGKFELAGTYYYGDGAFNDGPRFAGKAYFIPDRPGSLPHFRKRGGTWPIYIQNADLFIAAVASESDLHRVRRKGGGYLTGHAVIQADHFTAGIECDAPSYAIRFVALAHPAFANWSKTDADKSC